MKCKLRALFKSRQLIGDQHERHFLFRSQALCARLWRRLYVLPRGRDLKVDAILITVIQLGVVARRRMQPQFLRFVSAGLFLFSSLRCQRRRKVRLLDPGVRIALHISWMQKTNKGRVRGICGETFSYVYVLSVITQIWGESSTRLNPCCRVENLSRARE